MVCTAAGLYIYTNGSASNTLQYQHFVQTSIYYQKKVANRINENNNNTMKHVTKNEIKKRGDKNSTRVFTLPCQTLSVDNLGDQDVPKQHAGYLLGWRDHLCPSCYDDDKNNDQRRS